jgi:dipeptidyl aminopeptidase/acylaminoacyl peptidase
MLSQEGDGDYYVGISDVGNRVSMQWEGSTKKNIFYIDSKTGKRITITKNLNGMPQISPTGKYVYWYDMDKKFYSTYQNGTIKPIGKGIATSLYDEEYDMPSPPTPYGIMRWHEKDSFVYVYDRFDVWKVDPAGVLNSENITGIGRKSKTSYRMIILDSEKKDVAHGETIFFRTFDELGKNSGIASFKICCNEKPNQLQSGAFSIASVLKSKNSSAYLYTKETFLQSPTVFYSADFATEKRLSSINKQQAEYNWMTAELFTWKAYNGKTATGIVYKPENFDPSKKYPMIAYFYETLSDGLYSYLPPAPTPSRLNIPFFVSRGYIVLAPDIHYTDGNPGKSAFDYVVSGARALVKKGWVDSTKMGIQGQSWGGYQVAHIITRTPLFAAAWAGAPVANMTSAYGGIRWESGMNRQFQYEKSQSRIGATLWQKPQLYIENSPLFHLPTVKTPLVIMANDNDGAVPWYQGIELFTAMRRLNKPVWMLNYNGEAHNLVERKNRKDIQIREQQFFDWLLKGEKPAVWLSKGLPATEKGKSWGLEMDLD